MSQGICLDRIVYAHIFDSRGKLISIVETSVQYIELARIEYDRFRMLCHTYDVNSNVMNVMK